jgi:hypothetical protein
MLKMGNACRRQRAPRLPSPNITRTGILRRFCQAPAIQDDADFAQHMDDILNLQEWIESKTADLDHYRAALQRKHGLAIERVRHASRAERLRAQLEAEESRCARETDAIDNRLDYLLSRIEPMRDMLGYQARYVARIIDTIKECDVGASISGLECPICLQIMVNPCLASDSNSYCQECITTWFERQQTSPLTREPISPTLLPDVRMQLIINAVEKESLV